MEVTKEQFLEQRGRRFGHKNPERMEVPFWEMMVRNGQCGYWATAHFGAADERQPGPVWCFDRFGMSRTELPDGRTIYVAGEHEDHYDPDFCIYNDVIVKHDDGRVEIFGYPAEVFPPTDFHTATIINDDRLLLVGSLGYPEDRRPGETQVLILGLNNYSISKLETSGESPGWISRHEVEIDADRRITIRGGQVIRIQDGKQILRNNVEEFALDIITGTWQQLTERRWKQFVIRSEPGTHSTQLLMADINSLRPAGIPHVVSPGAEWNEMFLHFEGVNVAVSLEVSVVRVIVEGQLPDQLIARLIDEIRSRAEQVGECRCHAMPV